jgi:hypothetical protein
MAQSNKLEEIGPSREQQGVTVRAVVTGLAVIALVGTWATYVEMYARSSRLTLSHFPLALFAIFLGLLALNRRLKLSSAELLVVLSMGLVGAMIPVEGIVGFLLGIISSFYYFASPENQWAEYLHPYLQDWLVPRGSPEIWAQFFEGERTEQGIPWSLWVMPLFWWMTFILAILWVSACMMVVLRKQWAEHERLTFPLAGVASRLVSEEEGIGALRHNRLFLIGAAIPFCLACWQVVGWYNPDLPLAGVLSEISRFRFTRNSIYVVVNPFHFFTIGFGYFANVDVLFSIWFFFIIHVIEGAIFKRIGFDLTGGGTDQFSGQPPIMAWQGFGALLFMVFWGLWVARAHLRSVLDKAFRKASTVDDSGEMLSYRVAVFGGSAGLLYLFLWLKATGFTATESLLFLFISFVTYVGMARIVAETGVLYTWATLSPQTFLVTVVGTQSMAGPSMTALLLSYSLINYLRGLFMPALAHTARFAERIAGRRRLIGAVVLGAAFGLVFVLWVTLRLCYENGAYNTFGFPQYFNGNPKGIFSDTLSKVLNPVPIGWNRIMVSGIGIVLMATMTLLRGRLTWWRLHPIGFAMSSMINTIHLAIPIFIAWVIKSVLLSVGGVQLVRRTTPLFVGMIVGYVLGVAVCSFVDMIWYPGQGHRVHDW